MSAEENKNKMAAESYNRLLGELANDQGYSMEYIAMATGNLKTVLESGQSFEVDDRYREIVVRLLSEVIDTAQQIQTQMDQTKSRGK